MRLYKDKNNKTQRRRERKAYYALMAFLRDQELDKQKSEAEVKCDS